MLQQIKFTIFHTRWHFLRILQLSVSVMVFIQAITDQHYLLLIPSFILIYMALFNTCAACSSGSTCSDKDSPTIEKQEITYDEVK